MAEETRGAERGGFSRRAFLAAGGAFVAGSALPARAARSEDPPPDPKKAEAPPPSVPAPAIRRLRKLGRTGFEASDVSLGGIPNDAAVVKYAIERGINYFDTAEGYGNGDAERKIGEAIQGIDRKKIFVTTKLLVADEETEQSILDRFAKCQERLRTPHADALFLHAVSNAALVKHEGFHSAVRKLRADGRLRFAGISSHGPRGREGDSMEKVLCAAAEDGRFDLMLLVYNFLQKEEGEKVLAACKAKSVGTTAMKSSPAPLKVDPFDPENPTGDYADALKNMKERGLSQEEAIARIRRWVKETEDSIEKSRPFVQRHGIADEQQLRLVALKWVLANPDMHTVCMGLEDFDSVDRFVSASGTSLDRAEAGFLEDYRLSLGNMYCRHACTACSGACPHGVPVSTILRYASYFQHQGRERLAMRKYARLGGRDGSLCLTCAGSCRAACPHGFPIQAGLVRAHSLLSLA